MSTRLLPVVFATLALTACAALTTPREGDQWWVPQDRFKDLPTEEITDSSEVLRSDRSMQVGAPWKRVHGEVVVGDEFRMGTMAGGVKAVVVRVDSAAVEVRSDLREIAPSAECEVGAKAFRVGAILEPQLTGTIITPAMTVYGGEGCELTSDGRRLLDMYAAEVALGINRVLGRPIMKPRESGILR